VPIPELIGLSIVVAAVWLWLDSLRVRDAAIAAARQACQGENLQFLDESIAISSFRLGRTSDGALTFRRSYTFEFSATGDTRQQGSIVMIGHRVLLLNIGRQLSVVGQTIH
jgi:hypothetical protein